MSLWICFNAWLDYRSGKPTDRKMIDWLKGPASVNSDIIVAYEAMGLTTTGQRGLKDLATYSPIREPRGRRREIVIENINDRNNIIESIYRVRCNLFHGSKGVADSKDKKLVRAANMILKKWLSELLAII